MLTVQIVIPCFTEQRWHSILRAVRSAQHQTYAAEIVVVVDHNPRLAELLTSNIGNQVTILPNRFSPGASGARNTGAFAANTELVAFLDDDTIADPDWVKHLVDAYVQCPSAVGVGGCVLPLWEIAVPRWFPDEFLWVVGATPPGRPLSRVRNVWGSNMLVSRSAFMAAGGFCDSFGKCGHVSQPEDTELCVRMTAQVGSATGWIFTPDAIVCHSIPPGRATWSYFLRRCWSEGAGKSALAARPGNGAKCLRDETTFVRTVLTKALTVNLAAAASGDGDALAQAAAIVVGTGCAGAAFALAKLRPTIPRAGRIAQRVRSNTVSIVTEQPEQALKCADNSDLVSNDPAVSVALRDDNVPAALRRCQP